MKERAEVEIVLSNGEKAGKSINDLTAQTVKLARELKKLPEDSEEFAKKSADFKKVSDRLKDVKAEAFGYAKAQEDAKKQLAQFVPYNGLLGQMANTYNTLKVGTLAWVRSLGLARAALISTGIGAVVVVLGSLISYLTTTQAGIDKVTSVTRPLKAIFEVLKGVVQELGGKVFKVLSEALKNPTQALKDLGRVMLENVINRFTAFTKFIPAFQKILKGDFEEGFKDMADATLQVVTGIENVTDKAQKAGQKLGESVREGWETGTRFHELTTEIENLENELLVRRAELGREYKLQSEIAEDISRSEEERRAAAQRAIAVTEERLALEQSLIDKKIERIKIEQDWNDTSRADAKELAELEAERINFETQASEARTTARSKLNTVNQQIAAQEKKAIEEKAKQEEQALKEKEAREEAFRQKTMEAERALTDLRVALIQDESERKIRELELAYERDLAAFEGAEDQKVEYALLRAEQLEQDLFALEEAEAQKRLEKQNRQLAEEEERERIRIETAFYQAITSEEEKEQALYELQRFYMEQRLEALRQNHGEQSLEYQKLFAEIAKLDAENTQKQIENAETVARQKAQMEQMTYQAANAAVSGILDLMQLEEGARKKNFTLIKAINTAQVLANLPNEISGYWKAMAGTGPKGWIIAGLQTVTAIARASKAVSQINAQKLARGGVVFGPSHAQGGIPAMVDRSKMVEIEGGEIVLTKGVYQNPTLRAAASTLNVMGGGRAFAAGGVPVSPPISAGTAETQRFIGMDEFSAFMTEIRTWQRELRVVNNLQETRSGLSVLNQLQREADV